ncbi:MAG: hypothetical protein JO166_06940 [Deltaproteobacteria bacterium]|nr:hypothetical protein [Deltaproteobacteria bacterium]
MNECNAMSARLLNDAIYDLVLAPTRATDDEIRALLADSDLDDWYDCADDIWSANAIAESLLVTYRTLKHGGHSIAAKHRSSASQSAGNHMWWTRFEDLVDQHFAYWAVSMFLAGVAAGALQ